jgi:hypothetical protein
MSFLAAYALDQQRIKTQRRTQMRRQAKQARVLRMARLSIMRFRQNGYGDGDALAW